MAIKEGWRVRLFEDLDVGDVYGLPPGRIVTTTDNLRFTLPTQNTAPVRLDHTYAKQTEFGKLGRNGVGLPAPVLQRESRSRPNSRPAGPGERS